MPHLEVILLLRGNTDIERNLKTVAHRLFIGEKRAGEIMDDLIKSGFVIGPSLDLSPIRLLAALGGRYRKVPRHPRLSSSSPALNHGRRGPGSSFD